jgi:hypothetical protein
MQKWEYLDVRVKEDQIRLVNGENAGSSTAFPSIKREPIHEFLNRAGEEGWELVAHSPVGSAGSGANLVFKRPVLSSLPAGQQPAADQQPVPIIKPFV